MLYNLERRPGLQGGAARVIDQVEEVFQQAIGAGMPDEYLTGKKRDILHREIRRLQDIPASEIVDRTILLSLGAYGDEQGTRETILERLPSFIEKLGDEKWSDIFAAFATHPPLEEQEGKTGVDTDIRDEATTALAHAFPPEESLAFLDQYKPANFSNPENSTAIPIKRIIRAVRERIEWARNHGDISAIRENLDTNLTVEQLIKYVGLHPDTDEDIGTIVLRVAENEEEIEPSILVAALLSPEDSVGDVAATELANLIVESGGKMKPTVMSLLDEIPLDRRYSQSLVYLTTTIPALLSERDNLRELYAMLMKKVPPVERSKTKQFDPLVVGEFCFGLESILHNTRARHYIETLFGDQAPLLLEKLLHLYLNIPAENTMAIPRRDIISLVAEIVSSNRGLAHDDTIKPLISQAKEGFDQATIFDDYEEDEAVEPSWQRTESLAIGLLDSAATHFYN